MASESAIPTGRHLRRKAIVNSHASQKKQNLDLMTECFTQTAILIERLQPSIGVDIDTKRAGRSMQSSSGFSKPSLDDDIHVTRRVEQLTDILHRSPLSVAELFGPDGMSPNVRTGRDQK